MPRETQENTGKVNDVIDNTQQEPKKEWFKSIFETSRFKELKEKSEEAIKDIKTKIENKVNKKTLQEDYNKVKVKFEEEVKKYIEKEKNWLYPKGKKGFDKKAILNKYKDEGEKIIERISEFIWQGAEEASEYFYKIIKDLKW
jgi:hypothetical protein